MGNCQTGSAAPQHGVSRANQLRIVDTLDPYGVNPGLPNALGAGSAKEIVGRSQYKENAAVRGYVPQYPGPKATTLAQATGQYYNLPPLTPGTTAAQELLKMNAGNLYTLSNYAYRTDPVPR